MKIKNIAFFGVMASIFGIAGAEAADSTPTKIATTAYVTNAVTTHADDAVKHITAAERTAWNAKQNAITTSSLNGSVLVDSSVTKAKLESSVQSSLDKANSALQSSSTLDGAKLSANSVAKTALSTAVQSSLALADSALQSDSALNGANLNAGSVTKAKLESSVQTSLGKADSAVQPGDISDVERTTNKKTTGLLTANSTTKQITAVANGSATDYASTSAISSDLTKVKDALSVKQNTLDSSNKLDPAYVNVDSTHRFVTDTEKTTWGNKLDSNSTLNGAKLSANSVAKTALSTAVQSAITAAENISTTVTNAINDLDATVNATTNQVVTGVVETNGKITSVNATLIGDANIAAAGTANIKYGKMDAALNDINGTTGWSAASDCSATTPCVLTYVGSNTYKWTVMDIPAAN